MSKRSYLLDSGAKEGFDRCPEIEGDHLCTESADTGCGCSRGSIIARFSPGPRLGQMGPKEYRIHCSCRFLLTGSQGHGISGWWLIAVESAGSSRITGRSEGPSRKPNQTYLQLQSQKTLPGEAESKKESRGRKAESERRETQFSLLGLVLVWRGAGRSRRALIRKRENWSTGTRCDSKRAFRVLKGRPLPNQPQLPFAVSLLSSAIDSFANLPIPNSLT
jgi:hypothetical protein